MINYSDFKTIFPVFMIEMLIFSLIIATLGPTWEFQLCLKSCNLASWTTKVA